MLKTIKEAMNIGVATIGYPFEPLHQYDDYRGKPVHDAKMCIACGACAVACPPNAIQMLLKMDEGTTTWSINFGRCIFCGRCEEVCPLKAIKLSKEFELAVFDKNDLEENATYTLAACQECGEYYAPAKEVDYARQILRQSAGDADIQGALEGLGTCPRCKQKADAHRALRNFYAAGDPTPEPSEAQLAEARRIAEENRGKRLNDLYGRRNA